MRLEHTSFLYYLAAIIVSVGLLTVGCGEEEEGDDPDVVTVTFDANGGTFEDGDAIHTVEVETGEAVDEPESPTKDEHTFDGWFVDDQGEESWDFGEDTVDEDRTLYAGWSEEGGSDDELPGELRTETWRTMIEESASVTAPAVADDGTIYVGTVHRGMLDTGMWGKVAAVDPDGEVQWRYEISNDTGQGPGGIWSAPAIDDDAGILYAHGLDGVLYAFDLNDLEIDDGEVEEPTWIFETGSTEGTDEESRPRREESPAIDDEGIVYFGSFDQHLYAVQPPEDDADELEKLWSFDMGVAGTVSPVIGSDGTIYAGGDSGFQISDATVFAIEPPEQPGEDPQLLGEVDLGDRSLRGGFAKTEDTLYISVGRSSIQILDVSGDEPTVEETASTPGGGGPSHSAPAIAADGTIVASSPSGTHQVIGWDPETGEQQWNAATVSDFERIHPTPAIDDDGIVYVTTGEHDDFAEDGRYLLAVDPALGEVAWRVLLEGAAAQFSHPVIANGMLYFGTSEGELYAVEPDSSEPADSPWPMNGRLQTRTSSVQ